MRVRPSRSSGTGQGCPLQGVAYGVREGLRRESARVEDAQRAEPLEPSCPGSLLVLASLAVRHDDGRRRTAEDVHRRVVARLAHGHGRGGHLGAEVREVAHHLEPGRRRRTADELVDDRVGEERSGHDHGAQPVVAQQARGRLYGRSEQRRADQSATSRHEDTPLPRGPAVAGAGRADEPGVVHGHAQRDSRTERLLQGREPGVRVDQYRVEVLVRHPARAVVVALLVASAADQDVAQAAGDEGGVAGRARGPEERHQLARELPASEREELDQQHVGSRGAEGLLDHRQAQLDGFLDREPPVPADQRVVGVETQRRQVHDVDRGGLGELRGPRSAVEERDVEVLRQALGQVHRAHQVAETHRLLAVEEQTWSRHRRSAPRGPAQRRAVTRTRSRSPIAAASTRLIARTARSTSKAAAAYQSRSARDGLRS